MATRAPYCALLFLDDGYADADRLPELAPHPGLVYKRRWLHMGIASMLAYRLPSLEPMLWNTVRDAS